RSDDIRLIWQVHLDHCKTVCNRIIGDNIYFSVWNDILLSEITSQLCIAQADDFHISFNLTGLNIIPDGKLVFDNNENTSTSVFASAMRGEYGGYSRHSRTSKHRFDRDMKRIQNHHDDNKDDDILQHIAQQLIKPLHATTPPHPYQHTGPVFKNGFDYFIA